MSTYLNWQICKLFSKTLLISCLLLSTTSIFALTSTSPTASMMKIMQDKRYANAQWWILVKDLNTNKITYEFNSNHMYMPASTTKLFTTATALDVLGKNYRFKTPIYFIGTSSGETLNGILILVGKGDLELGSRVEHDKLLTGYIDHIYANDIPGASLIPVDPLNGLHDLAKQIAAKGIKHINGNVLVDNRLFETEYLRNYTISPLMINENIIDFQIKPSIQGKKATIQWRPQVPGYSIVNEVITANKGQESTIKITSNEDNTVFYVKGQIAADSKELLRIHSIRHPGEFAKQALIASLKQAGIEVTIKDNPHQLPDAAEYSKLTPIAEYTSPPLSEYVKVILKLSHNIGADSIPLLLAAHHHLTSFSDGMPFISDFLIKKVGINANDFVFGDGAGGDSNRLAPKAVIQLLTYMHQLPKEQYQPYLNALPILGVDGSIAKAAKNIPAIGKVHGKTGTSISYDYANKRFFSFSEALSGYIDAKNGHTLAFIIAVSNTFMNSMDDAFIIQHDVSAVASEIYNNS